MEQSLMPRIWLEVSKEALLNNIKALKKAVFPLEFMAVLKANGYGFGALELAECIADHVDAFGVVEVNVACALKRFGKPVHMLGAIIDEEIPAVVSAGVIAPITDVRIARLLHEEGKRQGKSVVSQLVVDSGMGRLGIVSESLAACIKELESLERLNIQGLYSHFPVAYSDRQYSLEQVEKVKEGITLLQQSFPNASCFHIANSDGIQNIDASIQAPFTLVRSGINMHGIYDDVGARRVSLQETFQLKTRLVSVRELPAGKSIGYGREYTTQKPSLIGTIPAGYADGIPFKWKDGCSVIIQGVHCPLVGRVSMDYTTVLLESVPDARVGDEVICLGGGISVYDWARARGTIPYEVICSIGSRVGRRFVEKLSEEVSGT